MPIGREVPEKKKIGGRKHECTGKQQGRRQEGEKEEGGRTSRQAFQDSSHVAPASTDRRAIGMINHKLRRGCLLSSHLTTLWYVSKSSKESGLLLILFNLYIAWNSPILTFRDKCVFFNFKFWRSLNIILLFVAWQPFLLCNQNWRVQCQQYFMCSYHKKRREKKKMVDEVTDMFIGLIWVIFLKAHVRWNIKWSWAHATGVYKLYIL